MSKTVIVTGASRGLGLAVAEFLVKEGHNVVACARGKAGLEELRTKNPERICILAEDLTEISTVEKLVELAKNEFGRIDGLVVNHGMLEPVHRIAGSTMTEWRHNFDTNFFSAVALVEAALPHLRECKGRIILTSSGAATNAYSTWGPYCASKAALKSFGHTLGVEEKDVTTVSVVPGVVDTEMQTSLRENHILKMDKKDQDKFLGLHRDGKMLKAAQPGNVMARLVLNAPIELSGLHAREAIV